MGLIIGQGTKSGGGGASSSYFRGKVISILGDSISTFSGYIPTADGHNLTHRARYPQADLLTDVEKTWWKMLINNLGAKLGINDSWAGSRVSNSSSTDSGDIGPNACMASLTRITNLGANGTPDIILFYGGTNDAGASVTIGSFDSTQNYTTADLSKTTWTNFADAYKDAIMRLQYYYPNALIVSILPMYTTLYYTIANLDAYNEQIKLICDYFGVHVIDLRQCGINFANKGTMLGDGIHPKAEGMERMEKYIRKSLTSFYELKSGATSVYTITHNLTNVTASKSWWKGTSGAFSETLTADASIVCTITMGGVDVTSQYYSNGTINIPSASGDIVITATTGDVPPTPPTPTDIIEDMQGSMLSVGQVIQGVTGGIANAWGNFRTISGNTRVALWKYNINQSIVSGKSTLTITPKSGFDIAAACLKNDNTAYGYDANGNVANSFAWTTDGSIVVDLTITKAILFNIRYKNNTTAFTDNILANYVDIVLS